ncbi:MAG TPA: rhodanese-like domain-containing protein [Hymenobacter sp.]|jgi:rhodanese-related sulfurtransferase|uniref:rhodanese-like domain-containing protein n=1 Tax=Hymenobacter sp. TaxID=1898978 RepID=UPI002ED9BAD6
MKILVVLLLLLWKGVAASSVQAQCLELSSLLAIGADPSAATSTAAVTKLLPAEWKFQSSTPASREAFWSWPAPDGGAVPATKLTVRPQRPGQDVVLKTTQAACIRQLRSELKSRKLTAQPVTCPGCEAVRFQAPDFEATVYSQMKGDYPFVVVVHQVPSAKATTGSTAPAAPSAVAAIDIASAVQHLADPQVTVLDVRTPEEYAGGHFNNAQNLNFRAADFAQQLAKLSPAKRYVLYCATGNRSGQAAALMQQQGILNVINAGGYSALKAAGAK